MSIAVSGATGQLGQLVVKHLASKNTGIPIIALVRTPEKFTPVAGVEVRKFNYSDANSESLKGVKVFILVSSNEFGQRLQQHKNAIEAAKKAGVETLIYTSLLNVDKNLLKILGTDHADTESYLKTSGITYSTLRNGWYIENITGSISDNLAHGVIFGASKSGKLSLATRNDYAEAAANAAIKSANGEKLKLHYELGGEAVTMDEFAAEVSVHAGKPVKYIDLEEAEYAAKLVSFGVPEGFAHVLADSNTGFSNGGVYTDSKDLENLLGHKVDDWREHIKTAVANAKA